MTVLLVITELDVNHIGSCELLVHVHVPTSCYSVYRYLRVHGSTCVYVLNARKKYGAFNLFYGSPRRCPRYSHAHAPSISCVVDSIYTIRNLLLLGRSETKLVRCKVRDTHVSSC